MKINYLNRRCLLTIMTSLVFMWAMAQSGTVAMGGDGIGSGGTISYTIGQPVSNIIDLPGYAIYQGLQQPYELFVTAIDGKPIDDPDVLLFPNPTSGEITLAFKTQTDYSLFRYVVYDARGIVVRTDKIRDHASFIDFSALPSGTYNLQLTNETQTSKTFLIIKN